LLAIVCAFKDELSGYLKSGQFEITNQENGFRTYESMFVPEVVISEGGIGKEGSQEGARLTAERFKPDLMISAGFAGGASEGLKPGDIFICDRLLAVEGPPFLWGKDKIFENSGMELVQRTSQAILGSRAEYQIGACLTVPQFVSNRAMKAWLGNTFNVSLIDMESYWVSEVAASFGIPCLSIRAVLDPVDQSVPRFIGETVDKGLGVRAARAVAHLLMNPVDAPQLVRLSQQVRAARSSLTRILSTIVSARTTIESH
jgi:adenosylhomocysteine nucleosidase